MNPRTTTSPNASPTKPENVVGRRAPHGRGRLRAAVEQLPPETIEAIAQRVAELLREPNTTPTPRLVDAEQLAHHLGLTRAWVYQHAQELGAIRLGHGPKAAYASTPHSPPRPSQTTTSPKNPRDQRRLPGAGGLGGNPPPRRRSYRSADNAPRSLFRFAGARRSKHRGRN